MVLRFRVGLTKVFFKAGVLAKMEDMRDEKLTGIVLALQTECRWFRPPTFPRLLLDRRRFHYGGCVTGSSRGKRTSAGRGRRMRPRSSNGASVAGSYKLSFGLGSWGWKMVSLTGPGSVAVDGRVAAGEADAGGDGGAGGGRDGQGRGGDRGHEGQAGGGHQGPRCRRGGPS